MRIDRLTSTQLRACQSELATLLKDAVDGGASVGFLAPLAMETAECYWAKLESELDSGDRIILAAWDGDILIGTVQLALAWQPNGQHRAEVQKMLVHSQHRGKGYAKALLAQIEKIALAHGRSLLVLDTERGCDAEFLYEKVGYIRAGSIPGFATNSSGTLKDNVIFYRRL